MTNDILATWEARKKKFKFSQQDAENDIDNGT